MKPLRLARRRCPGAASGRAASGRAASGRAAAWRARIAASDWRRLAVPAGTCLVAVLAGWPVMLAGPGGTGPQGPGTSAVLTAVRIPQARVLNPGPPTGLTASAGNTQVSLSWRPPAPDGGAAIIGYDVYMGTSPRGESRSSVSGLIGSTSFTVTGLTNGTRYYFTVDAVNGAELHSAPSAPASATPVTAPGAPRGLTVTAGDARVSLSWQAPGSDGGAAITGYRVYQGTSRKLVASATGTSATVKNLTNGSAYSFTVITAGQLPRLRGNQPGLRPG